MEKLKQLAIIFGFTFVSEILYRLLRLPIPASVYGLVILFMALQTGVIKAEKIEQVGNFLLLAMPVYFIAPGVNLMNIFDQVLPILWQAMLLIFISTIVVTVITGKVADYILSRGVRK